MKVLLLILNIQPLRLLAFPSYISPDFAVFGQICGRQLFGLVFGPFAIQGLRTFIIYDGMG